MVSGTVLTKPTVNPSLLLLFLHPLTFCEPFGGNAPACRTSLGSGQRCAIETSSLGRLAAARSTDGFKKSSTSACELASLPLLFEKESLAFFNCSVFLIIFPHLLLNLDRPLPLPSSSAMLVGGGMLWSVST